MRIWHPFHPLRSRRSRTPYRHVWVANKKNTSNLGDRLIGESFKDILREIGVQRVESVDFTGEGGNFWHLLRWVLLHLGLLPLAVFLRVGFFGLDLCRKSPDAVFIGGGQLLLPNDEFLWAIFVWVLLSKTFGFDLILYSVGTERRERVFPWSKRKLLGICLRNAKIVRLRDIHSQRLIECLVGRRFERVPDVVYGLVGRFPLATDCLANAQSDLLPGRILVCPAEFGSVGLYGVFRRDEDFLGAILDEVNQNWSSHEITLFVMVDRDRPAAFELIKRLETIGLPVSNDVKTPRRGEDLYALYKSSRLVVSARAHALIFAHILGIDYYAVCRNEKMKSFAEGFLRTDPAQLRYQLIDDLRRIVNGDTVVACERNLL